ncbi:hypothetical protein MNBD_NITROSPINAE02-680 [hydrothermal vent metagenome]|uniref:DUF342 domain-containing protein n=1 Tax=hydrothermal vent metagenome TaxID=652676 RepID=A0A3B1CKU6_9ZZZZ
MGFIIEFPGEFDKAVIVSKEYDSLEKLFVKPVAVSKGEVVARALESGKVYSHDLSGIMYLVPDGKKPEELVGDNLILKNGDPQEIQSAMDGCLLVMDGVLKVADLMEIFGDVDRRTGDITSSLPVRIHGGVAEGFKVTSEKDVEIEGLVEGAWVDAGGKATLKGGVIGADKGAVVARGDIYAKFAQVCKLESKGSITMDGPAMNCELIAAGKVTLEGESSALVGGVTRAREEVTVSRLGSQGALPTEVYVGYDPDAVERMNDREARSGVLKKMCEEKIKEMNFVLDTFEDMEILDTGDILSAVFHLSDIIRSGDTANFDPEQKKALQNLSRIILSLMRIDGGLKKIETEQTEDVLGKPFARAQINVFTIAHPGVRLSILGEDITLDREYERVRFILDNGKIKSVGI